MKKTLLNLSCLSIALVNISQQSSAQSFEPAVAHEMTYTDSSVSHSYEAAAFSFTNPKTTFYGDVDVYMAAHGTGRSEVTIIFTHPGDPQNVVYKQILPYDDGSSFQVGAVFNNTTSTVELLVAFQRAGYWVDRYVIDPYNVDPIEYVESIELSVLNYDLFERRIRIDSDSKNLSRAVLTWDHPTYGIQTIGYIDGEWSQIKTIESTLGYENPDLALFGDIDAGIDYATRYVYYDRLASEIYTGVIPFNELMAFDPAPLGPFPLLTNSIDDVNYVTDPLTSFIVLDTKDDNGLYEWAYTYVDNMNNDVFVRHSLSPNGSPYTTSINSSTLSPSPTSGVHLSYSPTLHYGSSLGDAGPISVGWYSTDGNYNGYIAADMTSDGTYLLHDAYLELPNAQTTLPYISAFAPDQSGIAFSKGDLGHFKPILYATYYDQSLLTMGGSTNILHHAFHDMNDYTAFKHTIPSFQLETKVYPNPFTNEISLDVNLAQEGTVRVEIIDIKGSVVKSNLYSHLSKGVNKIHINNLNELTPGTYLVNYYNNYKKLGTKKITKF